MRLSKCLYESRTQKHTSVSVCSKYIFKGFRGARCQTFVLFALFFVCDLDSSFKSNARITVSERKLTTAVMACVTDDRLDGMFVKVKNLSTHSSRVASCPPKGEHPALRPCLDNLISEF